jgi:hypothetical protein
MVAGGKDKIMVRHERDYLTCRDFGEVVLAQPAHLYKITRVIWGSCVTIKPNAETDEREFDIYVDE